MEYSKLVLFLVWIYLTIYKSVCNTVGKVQSWNMHEKCGETLQSYGGVIHFDATKLRRSYCQITIAGRGPEDTMISMFFTSFNVTNEECLANVTIQEPGMQEEYLIPFSPQGLYTSICKSNEYLNEYSLYTTDHNKLLVKYSTKRDSIISDMKFSIKFSSFISRIEGCSEEELASDMFSCYTGRCVHKSLLCENLNACGDYRDCNVTSATFLHKSKDGGFNYVTFIVVVIVVVFAMFALIQITLIARNKHTMCQPKKRTNRPHIEAELMPMNGHIEGKQSTRNGHIEVIQS